MKTRIVLERSNHVIAATSKMILETTRHLEQVRQQCVASQPTVENGKRRVAESLKMLKQNPYGPPATPAHGDLPILTGSQKELTANSSRTGMGLSISAAERIAKNLQMDKTVNQHVLLLEDDVDEASLLQSAFRRIPFWSTFVCRNLSQARCYLLGSGIYADRDNFPVPSVFITELRIDGDEGIRFLQWLREEAVFAGLQIMVLAQGFSNAERAALQCLSIERYWDKSRD